MTPLFWAAPAIGQAPVAPLGAGEAAWHAVTDGLGTSENSTIVLSFDSSGAAQALVEAQSLVLEDGGGGSYFTGAWLVFQPAATPQVASVWFDDTVQLPEGDASGCDSLSIRVEAWYENVAVISSVGAGDVTHVTGWRVVTSFAATDPRCDECQYLVSTFLPQFTFATSQEAGLFAGYVSSSIAAGKLVSPFDGSTGTPTMPNYLPGRPNQGNTPCGEDYPDGPAAADKCWQILANSLKLEFAALGNTLSGCSTVDWGVVGNGITIGGLSGGLLGGLVGCVGGPPGIGISIGIGGVIGGAGGGLIGLNTGWNRCRDLAWRQYNAMARAHLDLYLACLNRNGCAPAPGYSPTYPPTRPWP